MSIDNTMQRYRLQTTKNGMIVTWAPSNSGICVKVGGRVLEALPLETSVRNKECFTVRLTR